MKHIRWIAILLLVPFFAWCECGKDYLSDGDKAYENGEYEKAFKLYEKACGMGEDSGCYELGRMYKYGKGVVKDYSKAIKLYEKACDEGEASGCYELGWRYKYGVGVEKNYSEAVEFYKKACDMGENVGCNEFSIGKGFTRE